MPVTAIRIDAEREQQKYGNDMEQNIGFSMTDALKGAKRTLAGIFLAMAAVGMPNQASAQLVVDLGSAADFAVLAGSGITNTGPTVINGDVGSFPTATITGFGSVTLNGTNHSGDAITQAAKGDLLDAYNDVAGRTPDILFGPIFDMGGMTLESGVYNGSSSLGVTGILTLDAMGDPNAVWIFQAGSTLVTATGSEILLINGAQASNVFWQVGSSATLGTGSDFSGTILAQTSITLETGAVLEGRALALDGAVTLDTNVIVPEPASAALLALGLTTLVVRRRRVCRV